MNTFLKILLSVIAVLLVLKFLPELTAAVFIGSLVLLLIAGVLLGGAGIALAVLVTTALGAIAVLSPIWIPVVVVLAVLALIRRASAA